MKCIHCGKDSRYRDRGDGKCSQCGHSFAFEPKTNSYGLTDLRFQSALNEVSAKQTRYFTSRQFGYALDKIVRKREGIPILIVVGLGAVFTVFALWLSEDSVITINAALLLILGIFAFIVALFRSLVIRVRRTSRPKQATVTFGDSVSLFRRWEQTHGEVTFMLPSMEFPTTQGTVPEDIHSFDDDYFLSRALVTDTADIAHMLVMNGFHITDNCAILSVNGYPAESFDEIKSVLRKSPELEVYALHDASVVGCMLPLTLGTEKWFPGEDVRIIDLGLRPNHVGLMRVAANQGMLKYVLRNLGSWRVGKLSNAVVLQGPKQAVPAALDQLLSQGEMQWLENGNSVELAFMPPERLMHSIRGALWRRDQSSLAVGDGGFWFVVSEDGGDFGGDGDGDGDGDSGFG